MLSLHLLFDSVSDESIAEEIKELKEEEIDQAIAETQLSLASLFADAPMLSQDNGSYSNHNSDNSHKSNNKVNNNSNDEATRLGNGKFEENYKSVAIDNYKHELKCARRLSSKRSTIILSTLPFDVIDENNENDDGYDSTYAVIGDKDTRMIGLKLRYDRYDDDACDACNVLDTIPQFSSMQVSANSDVDMADLNLTIENENETETESDDNNDDYLSHLPTLNEIVGKFSSNFPFSELSANDVSFLEDLVKNNYDNIDCIECCDKYKNINNKQLRIKIYYRNNAIPKIVYFNVDNDRRNKASCDINDIIKQYNMSLINAGRKGNVTNVFVSRGIKLF